MPSSTKTSDLSETLYSITKTKIIELEKRKSFYASKKAGALEKASDGSEDKVKATTKLANYLAQLQLPTVDAKELVNVLRYLSQACYDPSLPADEVEKYKSWLEKNLDQQTHRLQYATLFSAVLSEHLHRKHDAPEGEENVEPSELDDSFELLKLEKDRLQQLREKFEEVVFNEVQTDEKAIQEYLESLFPTKDQKQTMKGMQNRFKNDTTTIFDQENPFDDSTLQWVLKGLLRNHELLTADQKSLVRDFQADSLVRAELCDVLNMRWAELESWSWTDDGSGFAVEPRRQLNGKWRIFMKEDVLQAILHHYIGASLCSNAKEELKYWLEDSMVPDWQISRIERDRRAFYLQDFGKLPTKSLNKQVNENFETDYFLSVLDDKFGYDDDEPCSAEDESSMTTTDKDKTWLDIKQQLLRHLASETLLKSKLYGDVAVVQTDLQWYATAIPHTTIFAVLRFAGLPEKWLTWIRKYLEVPLTMNASGGDSSVRKRVRGIPMSHSLEKYLGEMVLVFLDLAVRREAGILPYRMHDDIVLCGSTAECEKGWTAMQRFIHVMGLEFNKQKTGSVSIRPGRSGKTQENLPKGDVKIDFLKLNTSGKWVIDTAQVDAHVKQLKKQLGECNDVLSYIRTYNSCIGRFFGHTFGLPAKCFGPRHVDEILETHEKIQTELFGQGGIVSTLRSKLEELARDCTGLPQNFQVTDAFIFNPVLLGGLGVVNPFVPLLLVQSSVRDTTPEQRVDEFIEQEKEDYEGLKRKFNDEEIQSKKKRRTKIFLEKGSYEEKDIKVSLDEFMSFEEYVRNREWTSQRLSDLYSTLIKQATVNEINLSTQVSSELSRLNDVNKSIETGKLTADEKYIIQLYSDKMFDKFGTIGIIDKALAPLGVMKAVMGHKVTWQMVL